MTARRRILALVATISVIGSLVFADKWFNELLPAREAIRYMSLAPGMLPEEIRQLIGEPHTIDPPLTADAGPTWHYLTNYSRNKVRVVFARSGHVDRIVDEHGKRYPSKSLEPLPAE